MGLCKGVPLTVSVGSAFRSGRGLLLVVCVFYEGWEGASVAGVDLLGVLSLSSSFFSNFI